MSTTSPATTPADVTTDTPARGVDASWAISLFGTAVGAGILFLPMNAGGKGLWPLLVATILIGPMTYFAHRAMARMVCVSPRKGEDITLVARDYFGDVAGWAVTFLYFMAIFPIVLIYGVSITNTVDSLIVHQFNGPHVNRVLLSGVLIGVMTLVLVFGEKLMLAVTQALVYPLIVLLAGISIYLIPRWDFSAFSGSPSAGVWAIAGAICLTVPVLVFAFNHSPAISQFSLAMQRAHGDNAAKRASVVLAATAIMLTVFTMFFVWSCSLALGTEGLQDARAENVPVLSHLANVFDSPVLSYFAPAIAIAAIVSSYFGHVLGASEGAASIARGALHAAGVRSVNERKLQLWVYLFMFVCAWIAGILNPGILDMIETLSGPVIAALLYLMPMVAIYKVPALRPYRKQWSNLFVIIAGSIAILSIIYKVATGA
ncbi:HAAAP family serine/threonine permease [Corynebacterium uberis]|uniref:HAAAP family serine/threonine permease n=1 Tax=Corynebacterium TaxID=1716 RepID=UPI001D0AA198|nr:MULTISPECIES: HAAAP family serine/threonine permease [Corynebacterium]MCZ9308688.1 HAAAP family serine/threonine permease [Corynebacterium sp. c6VSa_13]UDL74327.1 HAAAP family serine/threonine permease [Corynebacterium uberis]UDL76840.1 HAAAP family serine/threonine permease [Corynebacterium uberis]UDL79053.1 HAAAP family serine/threonine permease [Corynebacterium uberis]UDL79291.1 HAAAP family serine/threonine permease [Corynebacterium uberis]